MRRCDKSHAENKNEEEMVTRIAWIAREKLYRVYPPLKIPNVILFVNFKRERNAQKTNGLGVKEVVHAKWGRNIGTLNRKFDLQRLVTIYISHSNGNF